MIQNKRDAWYESDECTINDIIEYAERQNQLRDAQIDAIKTYLFLKIGCNCKPLNDLFKSGDFNTINLDEEPIPVDVREFLNEHPSAAAWYEYCKLSDKNSKLCNKFYTLIKEKPEEINSDNLFDDIFEGKNYTEYLFSLPMGAGKTFLMAAFIYLDLYFAKNEPQNSNFAHNFIVFAPSGTKSSVIPSLRTIQNFDPSWIIPEPSVSSIKKELKFEVLDQNKSGKKSTKIKNPNVHKLSFYNPIEEVYGLVMVANAEKVILDRLPERDGQISFLDIMDEEDVRNRAANELRYLIGKIPSLSIFVDEVHHIAKKEIKLRAVINHWTERENINSVLGFSGTPYYSSSKKIKFSKDITIKLDEIPSIVYFYPLNKAVGNFLKVPEIKIINNDTPEGIIKIGVNTFLKKYGNVFYGDGTCPKLAIYCSSIPKLEEYVYPIVNKIISKHRLSSSSILKYHGGNKDYPQPPDSQFQFSTLDNNFSNIKIILLCQIGKEGWDCKSLTSIILTQSSKCPKNMVLQTSCRCLRQVDKGVIEKAIIFMNDENSKYLEQQLKKEQHITIDDFQKSSNSTKTIKRYDRRNVVKLPKLDYYQFTIEHTENIITNKHIKEDIENSVCEKNNDEVIMQTKDINLRTKKREHINTHKEKIPVTFNMWKYQIFKESFSTLGMDELNEYDNYLANVFEKITLNRNSQNFLSDKYDHAAIRANIRKAFCEKIEVKTVEELIPTTAEFFDNTNFTQVVNTYKSDLFFPESNIVADVIEHDNGDDKSVSKIEYAIRALEDVGDEESAKQANHLKKKLNSKKLYDRTYHYIPYKSDSSFEKEFLDGVLSLSELQENDVEIYYNGDKSLTDFRIKCYKKVTNAWEYVGLYTPDFVMLNREDNNIHKVLIIETKGSIYSNDPSFVDRKKFIEEHFVLDNNKKFGYERFSYLYLEDNCDIENTLLTVSKNIINFFKGE